MQTVLFSCPLSLSLFRLPPSLPSSLLLQDGTTVAAILVLDDTIYSGNLGDSKAVLCRRSVTEKGKLSFVPLTKDHNPSNVSYMWLFNMRALLSQSDSDWLIISTKSPKQYMELFLFSMFTVWREEEDREIWGASAVRYYNNMKKIIFPISH